MDLETSDHNSDKDKINSGGGEKRSSKNLISDALEPDTGTRRLQIPVQHPLPPAVNTGFKRPKIPMAARRKWKIPHKKSTAGKKRKLQSILKAKKSQNIPMVTPKEVDIRSQERFSR